MTPEIRKLIQFLLLFFVAYGVTVFIMSSGPVKPALHGFYKNTSVGVTELFLSRTEVQSQFGQDGRRKDYDRFLIRIGASQEEIQKRINEARRAGLSEISNPVCDIPFKPFEFYTVPLVFILSLLLVTPMSVKQKVIKLAIGLMLMLSYLWLKFLIQVLFSINFIYPIGMYEFGSFGKDMLEFLSQAMTMGLSIILGVIIWLALSFRQLPADQLKQLFRGNI